MSASDLWTQSTSIFVMNESPSPDWNALKRSREREYQLCSQEGDVEAALDLSWALQLPEEACNALEVRAHRKPMEAEIEN
jgi:hypothetical protein